jgi:hypothetical protein
VPAAAPDACPACGARSPAGTTCSKCGRPPPDEDAALDWRGIVIGGLITAALFTVLDLGVRHAFPEELAALERLRAGSASAGSWGDVEPAALALAGAAAIAFAAGGLLTGRLARGRTVLEAAIAAVLALGAVAAARRGGAAGLVGLLFLGPLGFALACLGGWIGARWQGWALRTTGRSASARRWSLDRWTSRHRRK